jgi:hypothetical protein
MGQFTEIVLKSLNQKYNPINNLPLAQKNPDSACVPKRYIVSDGCAIAQAVSRRLPSVAARVQTRVWSCGIL